MFKLCSFINCVLTKNADFHSVNRMFPQYTSSHSCIMMHSVTMYFYTPIRWYPTKICNIQLNKIDLKIYDIVCNFNLLHKKYFVEPTRKSC